VMTVQDSASATTKVRTSRTSSPDSGPLSLGRIYDSVPRQVLGPSCRTARFSEFGERQVSCVQDREQMDQRCSMATNFLSVGPTNSDCGRIRRLFDTCSSTCAVHPVTRETAKVGVNMSPGKPTAESTAAE
jgi:hypothetical protein